MRTAEETKLSLALPVTKYEIAQLFQNAIHFHPGYQYPNKLT